MADIVKPIAEWFGTTQRFVPLLAVAALIPLELRLQLRNNDLTRKSNSPTKLHSGTSYSYASLALVADFAGGGWCGDGLAGDVAAGKIVGEFANSGLSRRSGGPRLHLLSAADIYLGGS